MIDWEKLSGVVPVPYIVWTIMVLIAVIVSIIKIYPKIRDIFEFARKIANERDETEKLFQKHEKHLDELTQKVQKINEKLSNDKTEITKLEEITVRQQRHIEESVEERELIIRSLLSIVQGLQEVGANGPTKKAEMEIQEYLVRKSHKSPDEDDI